FFSSGVPYCNICIILMIIFIGVLSLSHHFGSIKGTYIIYTYTPSTSNHYKNSFGITGVMTILSGLLSLVPITPFVSSIGFIQQTKIYARMPFIFGSVMFFIMGI